MNRIYILTGAAGLLGSNISRQLVEKVNTKGQSMCVGLTHMDCPSVL